MTMGLEEKVAMGSLQGAMQLVRFESVTGENMHT